MCLATRQIDLASDSKKVVIMQKNRSAGLPSKLCWLIASVSGIVQRWLDLQRRNWWVNSYCEINVKTGFPPELQAWRFPACEEREKSYGVRAKPSAGKMSGRFVEICERWISGPPSSEQLWHWNTDWSWTWAREDWTELVLTEDNGSIECEQRVFHTPWMCALSWDEIIN